MAFRMVSLQKKTGTWFARKGLPKDVRAAYLRLYGRGHEELFRAPATESLTRAKALLGAWEAEIEAMLDHGGSLEMMADWGAKLAGATLRMAGENGFTRARVTLRPAELGGVEVFLREGSAGLTATVVAETPHAAQLLSVREIYG